MKVYTATGDRGKTSLFSGEGVPKYSPRIAVYGELDELNSVMAAVASAIDEEHHSLIEEIQLMQAQLLAAGAWLATTPGSPSAKSLKPFTEEPALRLESTIDRMSESLPDLKQFILPGGHQSASFAHIARCVCRRVERQAIAMIEEDGQAGPTETMKHILVFLNRLSDYLFVLARYCNFLHDKKDVLWKG